MSDDKPMFVKVTGPGRYQIKPYSTTGWLIFAGWMVANTAILLLLLVRELREQWWIIVALDLLVLVPFLLFCVRSAVPIERVGEARSRERRR
jgi:hypothetical protein